VIHGFGGFTFSHGISHPIGSVRLDVGPVRREWIQAERMILGAFKPPRFLKILGACSLAVWLGSAGVFFQLVGSRPRTPNPALGQVYELPDKGHVVYISLLDAVLFYGMMLVAAAGGITAVVIGRRIQESRRSTPARYQ
jgi:hypothetical protein